MEMTIIIFRRKRVILFNRTVSNSFKIEFLLIYEIYFSDI